MPTPLLLGGQELIFLNEIPIKCHHKLKKNKKKILKGNNESIKINASINITFILLTKYLYYIIMILNFILLYFIFNEIVNNKNLKIKTIN